MNKFLIILELQFEGKFKGQLYFQILPTYYYYRYMNNFLIVK